MDTSIPPFQNAGRWLEQLESPETAPDALGRTTFVHALTDALVRLPTDRSVVTAVYGPWGCGKTWLLEQVVQRLDHEYGREMITCRFSPWELKSEDQILAEFFATISEKIPREAATTDLIPLWTKLQQLTILGAIGSTGLISALVASGALQGEALSAASAAAPMLQSISSLFGQAKTSASDQEAESEPKTLREVKDRLSKELKEKLSRPILVIIDDLDRLTHPEIQLMIRLLNTTANLPKIHYLVFGDRLQIASALDPICGKQGDRYLEKLVQNSFQVPEPGENQVMNHLWEGFSRIITEVALIPENFFRRFRKFWQSFLHTKVTNFRDCHRLLRTFRFHAGALTKEGALEADPVDLIGIDFMRLFDPSLYSEIAKSPPNEDLFPGRSNITHREDDPSLISLIQSSGLDSKSACNALLQLFPSSGDYIRDYISHNFTNRKAETANNIGTRLSIRYRDRTSNYFTLDIAPGGIPEHKFKKLTDFYTHKDQLIACIKEINTEGGITELLNRIFTFPHYRPKGALAKNLLRALSEISDTIDHSFESGRMTTDFHLLEQISDILLDEMAKSGHQMEALTVITESEGFTLPLLLIEKLRHRSGNTLRPGFQSSNSLPRLSLGEINELCDSVAPRIEEAVSRSDLSKIGIDPYRMAHALGPERCERILSNTTHGPRSIQFVFGTVAVDTIGPGGSWPEKFDQKSPAYNLIDNLTQFASRDFWKHFAKQEPYVTSGPVSQIFLDFRKALDTSQESPENTTDRNL